MFVALGRVRNRINSKPATRTESLRFNMKSHRYCGTLRYILPVWTGWIQMDRHVLVCGQADQVETRIKIVWTKRSTVPAMPDRNATSQNYRYISVFMNCESVSVRILLMGCHYSVSREAKLKIDKIITEGGFYQSLLVLDVEGWQQSTVVISH